MERLINMEEKLQEHISIIKQEIPFIDIKTYSHNIISMELNIINSIYGTDITDAVILFLNLNDKGW